MCEYQDMANQVSQAFEDVWFEQEDAAIEAAIKRAQYHGLEEKEARAFVKELLAEKRRAIREQVSWKK